MTLKWYNEYHSWCIGKDHSDYPVVAQNPLSVSMRKTLFRRGTVPSFEDTQKQVCSQRVITTVVCQEYKFSPVSYKCQL